MSSSQTATIFVSMASYRDSECPFTLADLFAKATHPERVFVGVLWQVVLEEDGEAFIGVPCRGDQVRGEVISVTESRGVCWARHRIQTRLYQGEDFYLQIDSHTRFDPGWDVQLIEMWHLCPSSKPVLSTHPNKYIPPDELLPKGFPCLRAKKFNRDGILIPQGEYIDLATPPPLPKPTAFVGGGFLFASGAMVAEVPYDPYLYFHGEEISLSVRLWTHGYDLFSPNAVVLYHDYTERTRKRHWDDHQVDWGQLQKLAVARLEHVLMIRLSSDPEVLQEIERYGLGGMRTIGEYEAYADVDLNRRRIGARGLDGRFPLAAPATGASFEIRQCFTRIYAENGWGSKESRSGSGAGVAVTSGLRDGMRKMWHSLGVRVLVDAGCGDVHWLSLISGELDLYLGLDVVPALIADNRILFADRKNHFFNVADVCHEVVPRGDAVLCRNVLTHLPLAYGLQAVENFRRSQSRYLLATTFPGCVNGETKLGHWRKLDLTAPPFSLPKPLFLLPDGKPHYERFLGVWRLDGS